MIDDMLCGTVRNSPDRVAIVFGERRIDYRELAERISVFRRRLYGLGATAGKCVLIALPNCPEFVIAYFATAGIGATVQAVDPRSTEHEHERYLRECSPAVVVTDPSGAELFRRLAPAAGLPTAVVVPDGTGREWPCADDRDVRHDEPVPPVTVEPDAPWVFGHSSGSTGEPKRVCRSQANQVAEADNIVGTAGITHEDVILCPVPLFHALGQFCCMIVAVRAGATLVLLDPAGSGTDGTAFPPYVGMVIELVRRHRVTVLPAVPYIFEALAEVPAEQPADFSSVRLCLSGSNFLSPAVRNAFHARFGVPLRQTYGSTEAGSVSWDCGEPVTEDSVGRPLAGVSVEIIGEDGRALPDGAVGEIVVGGRAVMVGYADRATESPGVRGYRTGDLGWMGSDGCLRLVGRKRMLIDVGGRKVNPVEVERVLEGHPGVAEAIVVGVPSGGSSTLAAAVIPAGTVTAEQVRAYCRERLTEHRTPSRITFVTDFPRSPLGKPLRGQVAARLAGGQRPAVGSGDGTDVWREPDAATRSALIAGLLVRRAAETLGVSPDEVRAAGSLRASGLDSLGALRLKMALQEDLHRLVGLPELLGGAGVAELARRLADLTDDPVAPLPTDRPEGEFPLSYNQLSLWHADQVVAPEAAAYNQGFAARLVSGFDADALRRTFQALVDRHPVLRTTFVVTDGVPRQRVAAQASVDFGVVRVPPDGDADGDVLGAEVFRPFDLRREPPLRVRLYLGGTGGPLLLVTVHHIVTDFWSLVTMVRELRTIYAGEVSGAEVYLPPQRHSYRDYVSWLAGTVDGPVGERDWAYWREVLRLPPPALDLPVDRPRTALPRRLGAMYFDDLDADRLAAVREFARAEGLTVYTVLLAACYVLLAAYTGEHDIAVAAMTTNRQRTEFQDVLGYFVNPVVCRVAVADELSFRDLLAAVRDALGGAIAHQTLPFEVIVERLGLKRDRGRAPLVEVAFNQNKAHDADMLALSRFLSAGAGRRLRLGALELESVALPRCGAVYDLAGTVYESAESISIGWEYNTDLFEEATIRRIGRDFAALLGALLAGPTVPIGRIDVVRGEARRHLIAASRGRRTGPVPTVPELVAAQAARRPASIAVVACDDRLTYGELADRATALAHRMLAEDVTVGTRVDIRLDPGPELAVAGLAALMVGAVVDPRPADEQPDAEPPARVGGRLLLTTTDRCRSGAAPGAAVVCVDRHPAEAGAVRPGATVPRDGSAMVMWTSGVTGPPRTAVVDGRSLARYTVWFGETYRPRGAVLVRAATRPDRMLAQLLAVLVAGATAVLGTAGGTPEDLAALLGSGRRFDLVHVTPTELALMLPVLRQRAARPAVAALAVSGEPLYGHVVRGWREIAGASARIVHEYGGADPALVVSAGDVPARADADRIVPVGRPVPDVECRVLDRSGRLCPIGVPGEIHVGTRGGDGDESDGDESDGGDDPGRLRPTGDVGCSLGSGELVVLGRRDRFTSVRGYRVDLGAVEAALSRRPEVTCAAAVPGPAGVSARCVPAPGTTVTGAELRRSLRDILPEYLVPAEITIVDALAFAGNGKLANAVSSVPSVPADRQAPREPEYTRIEALLAGVWQEVLGVAKVTPEDDYFDLDGDSITSMRIVSRAAELGIRVTPRQLFTHPVLRDLAAVAEVARDSGTPAAPAGDPRLIPLTPIQHWFFGQDFAEINHWNQSVLLTASGPVDTDVVRAALRAVAEHHPAFRLRFTRMPTGWRQRLDPEGEAVRVVDHVPAADRCGTRDQAVSEITTTLQTGLNVTDGPVFAAAIVPAGAHEGPALVLVAHHLVVDFVSWQIVIDDLNRACRQLTGKTDVELPAGHTSFADWARALRRHADSPSVRAESGHWTGAASGSPAAGGAQRHTGSTERHSRRLSAELSHSDTALLLDGAVRRNGVRPHEIVLAAVAHAVAAWQGTGEVCVDVESHGRQDLPAGTDLSQTVGWFTAMRPVRYRSVPERTPAGALRVIRDDLARTAADGLGYGLLRYLGADRAVRDQLAALPPATVNFNYLGRLGHLVRGAEREPGPGALFVPKPLPVTADRGPGNLRPYPLEISALLRSGRLSVGIGYSEREHQRRSVAALAQDILRGIHAIVADLASPDATEPRAARETTF